MIFKLQLEIINNKIHFYDDVLRYQSKYTQTVMKKICSKWKNIHASCRKDDSMEEKLGKYLIVTLVVRRYILGAPEIAANLYCNYLHWEG